MWGSLKMHKKQELAQSSHYSKFDCKTRTLLGHNWKQARIITHTRFYFVGDSITANERTRKIIQSIFTRFVFEIKANTLLVIRFLARYFYFFYGQKVLSCYVCQKGFSGLFICVTKPSSNLIIFIVRFDRGCCLLLKPCHRFDILYFNDFLNALSTTYLTLVWNLLSLSLRYVRPC